MALDIDDAERRFRLRDPYFQLRMNWPRQDTLMCLPLCEKVLYPNGG